MNKGILTTFLNKITAFPIWLQKIICLKISKNLAEKSEIESDNDGNALMLYVPTLTMFGKGELQNHSCGFDSNIYNFLSYCEKQNALSEISLNSFMTLEEVTKIFLFCINQNLIEQPTQNIEILAGFIAGKYRTGEYFLKHGNLTQNDLEQAIEKSLKGENKFAEILIEQGAITKQDAEIVLNLKETATKRFVLDYNAVEYKEADYQKEIEKLKFENQELKNKITKLSKEIQ